MDTKKELKERALVEMKANKDIRFEFSFSLIEIISIVGALQLALRHPKYTGPSSDIVRKFIETVFTHFDKFPALQEAIKSEDDPYADWKPRKRSR